MKYNLAQYQWQVAPSAPDSLLKELHQELPNLSKEFIQLCINRGFDSLETIQEVINPEPQLFHNPFDLFQMDRLVAKIHQSLNEGEKILIYGDYDADGITSTLILLEALESLGADVDYYLPNRHTDGYGPNIQRWNQLVDDYHYDLIITCDNGVAGHEAIDSMNERGVTVIVTDHHELQATLPNAYAIIHPKHPQGQYPFTDLSGAGVALKVASALLNEIPIESIELAAIGTVADMVSLSDENRTIVKSGLKLMEHTLRPGLMQLLTEEGVSLDKIDSDTIGFIIGPRLNAVGRLGDPSPGLELLRTIDDETAHELLLTVNEKNNQRKTISQKMNHEVEEKLQASEKFPLIILESSQDWPAGVLGIVAGQMMNKYQRPVILFQYIAEDKVYKGSGRSIPSINIFDLLSSISDSILYFGGHAQAAGLTVSEEEWENFSSRLRAAVEEFEEEILAPEALQIDMVLNLNDVDENFVNEIYLLGPFGMDNSRPMFMFESVDILESRAIGNNKQHLRLTLSQDNSENIPAIGFSMANQGQGLQVEDKLSLVGQLNINEWQGRKQAQIMLKDLGVKGHHWIDVRGSQINQELFSLKDSLFVFDQTQSLAACNKYTIGNTSILYGQLIEKQSYQNLVIMEAPQNIVLLEDIIRQVEFEKIYLGSYLQYSKYLAGPLTRADFTQLYKFLLSNPDLDYQNQLGGISEFLEIPYIKIYSMFQVFLEAEFVTMKSGQLKFKPESRTMKLNLPQLEKFQEYQTAYQAEALLNYQPIDKIKNYFERK